MTLLEGFILGLVQGITEWLPISSEGMLTLIMVNFFDKSLEDAIYFSIWLHIGTMFSVLVYYRKKWAELVKAVPEYVKTRDNPLITFLLISTVITGILGALLLFFVVENLQFDPRGATIAIGVLLIITGVIQFYAPRALLGSKEPLKKDGVLVGFVQSLAVFPGLSRSGLTTSTLLFRGYSARDALELSFLMSVPVVLGAQIGLALFRPIAFTATALLAAVVAFVSGLLTIAVLVKVAEKVNFGWFCIALGFISMLAFFI